MKTAQFDADGMDSENPGGPIYRATDFQRMDQKTMHGGVGDPRPSTAVAGKVMIDASIADAVKTVQLTRAAEPFLALGRERNKNTAGSGDRY